MPNAHCGGSASGSFSHFSHLRLEIHRHWLPKVYERYVDAKGLYCVSSCCCVTLPKPSVVSSPAFDFGIGKQDAIMVRARGDIDSRFIRSKVDIIQITKVSKRFLILIMVVPLVSTYVPI